MREDVIRNKPDPVRRMVQAHKKGPQFIRSRVEGTTAHPPNVGPLQVTNLSYEPGALRRPSVQSSVPTTAGPKGGETRA